MRSDGKFYRRGRQSEENVAEAMEATGRAEAEARVETVIVVEEGGRTRYLAFDGTPLYQHQSGAVHLDPFAARKATELGPNGFDGWLRYLVESRRELEILEARHRQLQEEFDRDRVDPPEIEEPESLKEWFKVKLDDKGIRDMALEHYMALRDRSTLWKAYKQAKQAHVRSLKEVQEGHRAIRETLAEDHVQEVARVKTEAQNAEAKAVEMEKAAEEVIRSKRHLFMVMRKAVKIMREQLKATEDQQEVLDRFLWVFSEPRLNVEDLLGLRADKAGVVIERDNEDRQDLN